MAEEIIAKIHRDGDQWCALIGKDLQEGICGFGGTVADALEELAQSYRNYCEDN
jgi:hypothetical protein